MTAPSPIIVIEKEAEIRIAAANATVNLYNKITANVFGTPEDVARMAQSFGSGIGFAKTMEGFLAGASPEALAVAAKAADVASALGTAAAERLRSPGSGSGSEGGGPS